jgi:DNA primase large subunit
MISEREAAKYPFLRDAVGLVDVLDLTVDDLADPNYSKVLDRAENRVLDAILKGESEAALGDSLTELLAFPVANMFVTVIGDDFLDRRYALSEAVRANSFLLEESDARIAKMARVDFDWGLRLVSERLDGRLYGFELYFSDYLRNAAAFREPKWKLVNRLMREGYVLLTKPESARLLQEEVKRRVGDLVSEHKRLNLPEPLKARVVKLRRLFEENRSKITGEDLPSEVLMGALPPCIQHAYEGLVAGRRLGHMERFALTSFLVNAGMEIDEIVKLFVSVTDFDEEFTRYQIEHIAGLRGSRTRYTPPTCSTLRTHGICYNPDKLCSRVKHPLGYYRIKVRQRQRDQEEEEESENSKISGE